MNKTFTYYASIILTILAIFPTVGSGIAKIVGVPEVAEKLGAAGFGPYLILLGVLELLIATLFIYYRTINIGFFLACSYFGGAIAVDLGLGENIVPPVAILTIYWIAAYLRKPTLFINQ